MDHLRKTWMQPGSGIIQTSFIVVGPIPECGGLHATTGKWYTTNAQLHWYLPDCYNYLQLTISWKQ